MSTQLPYNGPWTETTGPCTGTCQTSFETAADGSGVAHISATADDTAAVYFSATQMQFSRTVNLPPGGPYTVCVDAELVGSVFAGAGSSTTASVDACAKFLGTQGIVAQVRCGSPPFMTTLPNTGGNVSIATGQVEVCTPPLSVSAGTYSLDGTISVSASIMSVTGGAFARFYPPPGTGFFKVSGNFSGPIAVPAVGPWYLLAFALCLGHVGWRTRRGRPSSWP